LSKSKVNFTFEVLNNKILESSFLLSHKYKPLGWFVIEFA